MLTAWRWRGVQPMVHCTDCRPVQKYNLDVNRVGLRPCRYVFSQVSAVACALVLSGCHYTEEEKRAVAACSTSGPVRRRPRASKSSSIGIAVPTSTVTEAAGGVRTVMATYFSSRRTTRSSSRSQVPCRKPQASGSRLLRDARNDMWSARDDNDARCDPGQVPDRVASSGRVQTLVCSPSPVLRAHSRAVPETIGRRLARQRRRIGQRRDRHLFTRPPVPRGHLCLQLP